MRTEQPLQDQPAFSTLLWDNAKTTGVFGGAVTGIPTGLAAGALGLLAGTPELAIFGYFAGAAITAPIHAAIFALPFAIAAQHTREFKSNAEIETTLTKLASITDENDQKKIIKAILKEDNKSVCGGIRSLESFLLVRTLSGEDSTDTQWSALNTYMRERSGHAYTHNGKKLYNIVLDTTNKPKSSRSKAKTNSKKIIVENNIHNQVEIVRQLLKKDWSKEGSVGFFSNFTPKGIEALRACFKARNGASDAELASQLKTIVHNRGSSCFRSMSTKKLYEGIKDLGKGSNEALDNLAHTNNIKTGATETTPLMTQTN